MNEPACQPATGNAKATSTVTVTVNDQPLDVAQASTLADLLKTLQLRGGPVAVELNQQLVPSNQLGSTTLQNGDQLEVVSLTGGG